MGAVRSQGAQWGQPEAWGQRASSGLASPGLWGGRDQSLHGGRAEICFHFKHFPSLSKGPFFRGQAPGSAPCGWNWGTPSLRAGACAAGVCPPVWVQAAGAPETTTAGWVRQSRDSPLGPSLSGSEATEKHRVRAGRRGHWRQLISRLPGPPCRSPRCVCV